MKVFGVNVTLAIAMSMLPGILYFIWFQKVGRKKAYLKFAREQASGKFNDWQHLIMDAEEKRAGGIEKVKPNGLIAFDNDMKKFNHWLNSSIAALNHQKPIDLLITEDGVNLVNNELLRIEHSVY